MRGRGPNMRCAPAYIRSPRRLRLRAVTTQPHALSAPPADLAPGTQRCACFLSVCARSGVCAIASACPHVRRIAVSPPPSTGHPPAARGCLYAGTPSCVAWYALSAVQSCTCSMPDAHPRLLDGGTSSGRGWISSRGHRRRAIGEEYSLETPPPVDSGGTSTYEPPRPCVEQRCPG